MAKKKTNYKIIIVAMLCITALEIAALYKGINGVLLTGVIGVLAGLAGWSLPQLKTQ